MLDLFKKGVLMGLGLITVTKEKAEKLVDEFIREGELAKDKRATAIRDLLENAEEQEKILIDKVSSEINKAIVKLGLPTREDYEKLEKKIDKLSKQ